MAKAELLRAARRRVNLPPGQLWLDYQDDVDTLYISLKEKTHPTHSKSDVDDLVVFDYEGRTGRNRNHGYHRPVEIRQPVVICVPSL